MSTAPISVGEHELAIFLVTNEPVPARPLLNFLYEVERRARLQRHLGPSAVVEILEIRTGTKLVWLSFDRAVALAGLAVAVAAYGNDVAGAVQQPSGRLAETMAAMCLDNGVVECVITTSKGQVRISRDQMPAVELLQQRREDDDHQKASIPHSDGSTFSDGSGYASTESRVEASPVRYREAEMISSPAQTGRVYTVVGKLTPPNSDDTSIGAGDYRFTSLSGRSYLARGVNPTRTDRGTVIIRAELIGNESGLPLLEVKDVFTSDEP